MGDAQRLEELSNDFDTLVVHGSEVHWRMRGRSTDSQLSTRDWEKALGPLSSTTRNATMLTKLVAKLDAAWLASEKAKYTVTKCPVSGEDLGAKAVDVLYGTRLVRLCCKDCVKEFEKKPEPSGLYPWLWL